MTNVKCQMDVCLACARHVFYKIIIPTFLIFNLSFVIGCGDLESTIATLTVSPSSVTVGVGQSQFFTATGKNSLNQIIEITPSWSVAGNIGTINSSSGLFIAGSSSGTGYVVASYGGQTARSVVTITESGWLAGRIQGALGYAGGIRVYLAEDTSLLDISDSNGYYSISNIPAGTYFAQTEATDVYQAASQEVTITKGSTATWNIVLATQPGVPIVPTTTIPNFYDDE